MVFAREITSLVHSIRKNPQVNVKVRQPLARVLVPVLDEAMAQQVLAVQDIILSEINVKALEIVRDGDGNTVIVKKAKANFKALGARLGQKMKFAARRPSKNLGMPSLQPWPKTARSRSMSMALHLSSRATMSRSAPTTCRAGASPATKR